MVSLPSQHESTGKLANITSQVGIGLTFAVGTPSKVYSYLRQTSYSSNSSSAWLIKFLVRCSLEQMCGDLARLDKYVTDQEEKCKNATTIRREDQSQLEGRRAKRSEKQELVEHLAGVIAYSVSKGEDARVAGGARVRRKGFVGEMQFEI